MDQKTDRKLAFTQFVEAAADVPGDIGTFARNLMAALSRRDPLERQIIDLAFEAIEHECVTLNVKDPAIAKRLHNKYHKLSWSIMRRDEDIKALLELVQPDHKDAEFILFRKRDKTMEIIKNAEKRLGPPVRVDSSGAGAETGTGIPRSAAVDVPLRGEEQTRDEVA